MKTIKTVNIIGLGALGMLYGKNLTDALGYENVHFIMNRDRFERYRDQVYICNGEECRFNMQPLDESKPADMVLVAVKYPSLESALEDMAGSIGDDTIIMSVMNGISSEEILAEKFGAEKVIYTVAQGMDSAKFGPELKYSKTGELHIGLGPESREEDLEAVKEVLAKANLEYVVEDDILYRMWGKFMLNVGVNQTCMVYGTTYGGVINEEEPHRTFISAMREVIAVANAEGIALSEDDLNMYVSLIASLQPDLMPSMAQDRINKKPCEVDAFSGKLIELADRHGLHVPVNRFLNKRAKEIESEYI
ncbi:MAG: ketopantoate reductase family protein [Lachnospiraceae bacterium]|nr:ketopantoate reductase family protein [Lachnospiraceae bacterium]